MNPMFAFAPYMASLGIFHFIFLHLGLVWQSVVMRLYVFFRLHFQFLSSHPGKRKLPSCSKVYWSWNGELFAPVFHA